MMTVSDRLLIVSRRIGKSQTAFTPRHADFLLMFMAAQPDETNELDIDREEAGILEATAKLPLHLRVEESGCLEFLAPCMALEASIEALHLSCHGTISNGEPVLLLEDAKGKKSETAPAELVRAFGESPPPLIGLPHGGAGSDVSLLGNAHDPIRCCQCDRLGWLGL